MLRTTDGGATWTVLTGAGGTLTGKNATGVAARGATLLMSVNNNNGTVDVNNIGIYRSTDTGATFTRVSGTGGLPLGRTFDLAADPSSLATFYTSVRDSAANGVYKSHGHRRHLDAREHARDGHARLGSAGNVEDLGRRRRQRLRGDLHGLAAGHLPLGQRRRQLGVARPARRRPSIRAARRAPTSRSSPRARTRTWSSSAATGRTRRSRTTSAPHDFSGRLFRDRRRRSRRGSQAQHLTHSNALGAPGGGTANNSAPHADSRVMVIDANGEVIEGDDGGVYRRTIPANNTGIWRSLIGNLVSTEFHGIAFDSNTNTVFGGTQDNGTPQQVMPDNQVWSSISTADGGDVSDRRHLDRRASPSGTRSFQNLRPVPPPDLQLRGHAAVDADARR